ncbi:MAG: diguanylate cyclase [Lachnospiraceae bacterium]|nr:diguanylate cyclase [Ruminococcus sp.]MCM1275553.1 diguanylate cyclase [Lachnospiraceae bacterium]
MKNDYSMISKLADEAFDGYGIYRLADGRLEVLRVNEGYVRVLGYSPEENTDVWKSLHPEDAPVSARACAEAAESGKAVRATVRRYDKNGEPLYLEGTHISLGNSEFLIAFNDVSQHYANKAKLEAIVHNFDSGIALVKYGSAPEIAYANDKFYSVLNIPKGSRRLVSLVRAVVEGNERKRDLRIKFADGSRRVVRVQLIRTDIEGRYIIVVIDVTGRRALAKNRIAERTANASAGLYDEVFELDYKNMTTKLVSSRRFPERAENAKPLPLDYLINDWAEKYAHPDDRETLRELYAAPVSNPDFTDHYAEIRVLDAFGDGEYHTFGMVLVRSGAAGCMMFSRDKARFDDSVTSAQVEETSRLYKLVAEQTNTTVIESDHVAGRTFCSPSIKEYWASGLDKNIFTDAHEFRKAPIVHPDDRGQFSEFLERLYKSDGSESVILRLKMSDGSFKWCRLTITLTRAKNGNVTKSLCTINNVHDEVVARMKAEKTDELLQRTVRHIPLGVGVFRFEDGRPVPVYMSDNIFAMFRIKDGTFEQAEYSLEEFIGNNDLSVGAEGEYTFNSIRADGTRFWLHTSYRVIEEDGETLMYAAVSDVTERVESRRRAKVQEQMYQVLLEETGTIVFNYDPEKDALSYMRHSYDSGNEFVTVENVGENPDGFELVCPEFRPGFVSLLKTLSKKAGSQEIPVKINVDGYPRHYKAFFKSVCDTDGNVFEIIGKLEDFDDEMTRLENIQAKAMYDSLCIDIYNKATTEELIKTELEHSAGGALLMIDIDDFKSINDSFGHMFGDEFLKKFASTVKGTFRDTDIVGRYGGDEFFVFMPHATAALAEKRGEEILRRVVDIDVPMEGGVKSSVGVAAVNPDNRGYRQLLKQADSALYRAKNNGKNCVVLFDRATMEEGAYRTEEAVKKGRTNVVLSSNPEGAASIMMRVFSALYSSADISEGINRVLALVGKTFEVSRMYIFEDTDDGLYTRNTFEWCNEGVSPEIDNLKMVSYEEDLGGDYLDNMNDDGIFYCHDINELPVLQRDILARQGVKSLLQCSIVENGVFKGFVGFDECRSNRFWTQEQIDSLVFLSKVLSVFLLKARADNYASSLKSILDNHQHALYIVDAETRKLLYLNKLIEDVIGKGKLGTDCCQAICGGVFGSCPISALRETGSSRELESFSPVFNKHVRARASEVVWEGRPAYLVNCTILDD